MLQGLRTVICGVTAIKKAKKWYGDALGFTPTSMNLFMQDLTLVAHKGMNISEQEYLAVMDDIVGAMNKHKLDEDTKKDVIAIFYSLKDSIIRV